MSPTTRNLFVVAGQRFGVLTVLREIDHGPAGKNGNRRLRYMAECVCDCGNTTEAVISALYSGARTSCGCRKGAFGHNIERLNRQPVSTYYATVRTNAQSRRIPFSLSLAEYEALTSMPCAYCGREATGLDRLDNDYAYEIGNVVPACKLCNKAKGALTPSDFLSWLKQAAGNLTLKGWKVEVPEVSVPQVPLFGSDD